jgi:phospholipid transport system substrate-binding protein
MSSMIFAMFRRFFLVLLIVPALLLAPHPAVAANSCGPESFIISAGLTYDRAARAGSATAFAAAAARYSDMHAIAIFALGRYRKLLPASREAEYVRLTKTFMGQFMLKYSSDFRVGKMTIIDCSGPPSNISINARTSSGDRVSFRVYRARQGYLIRDIKVSSIWLVQQMRSTFVGTISRTNGDIEELFKYLRS